MPSAVARHTRGGAKIDRLPRRGTLVGQTARRQSVNRRGGLDFRVPAARRALARGAITAPHAFRRIDVSDNDRYTLPATARTEFGKGAARRARRAGLIPAVLYGHGADPVHLSLPGHETWLALKDNPNALLTLKIDDEDQLALSKDVQRDPVRRTIDHVDLVMVRRGEKVSVEVAVEVQGESAPGTIHTVEQQTVLVLAEATSIPESIIANIEDLGDG